MQPLAPLMNRQRAEGVLAQRGIAALVLTEPLNIYHATGFWPLTSEMGQLGASVAVVPADLSIPVQLIVPQFLYYFRDTGAAPDSSSVRVLLYTAPAGGEHAAPPFFFRDGAGPADTYERAARDATSRLLVTRPAFRDARSALAAALDGMDGAVAVDSFTAQSLLTDRATSPAEPLLRLIRMIKSPAEIALMRHAARTNAEATCAAVAAMTIGDSYADLRRAFGAETTKRDGHPVFLEIDSASYAQRDGTIRDGRAFSIDAVAHYARYHGDYGRTVIVGSPTPALARALEAATIANEAVARALRPGLRYSKLAGIGRVAAERAGLTTAVLSAPHSVGLSHTDEAFDGDALVFAKADHVIEADMVLSVDCPVLETDMDGTVHLENLWLITATGAERLNDLEPAVLRI